MSYFDLAADLARGALTSPIEDGKVAYHRCVAAVNDIDRAESHRLEALADRCEMLAGEFLSLADSARMKARA